MPPEQVHLNGKLVDAAHAAVSVWDAGFLHGASTFTTMRAHNGVVFRLDRHLSRLLDTAGLLGLRVSADAAGLESAVYDVLDANGLTAGRLRATLSAGSVRGGEPTTLVTAEPLPQNPSEWYSRGIVAVVSSQRQELGDVAFGHKTGCYLQRIMARREAAERGGEEALLFTPDNRLAEACFSNVFLVLDGRVLTPPVDTPVLPGVIRQAVLEICQSLGIPCQDDQPLTVRDMLAAQEVFLTASVSLIRPVRQIEAHPVGQGTPGEVTKRISQALAELMDRECQGR